MKRIAGLLGLMIALNLSPAVAEEFKVDAKRYEKVRRHIEKYGSDDVTSDGNPALCVEGVAKAAELIACMNFVVGAPMGDQAQIIHAVYRTYSGPVEVIVRGKGGSGAGTEITFYLTTDGRLVSVIQTTPETQRIPPDSLEAREVWQEISKQILRLLPTYEI